MKGVGFMKENEVKVAKNDENEKKTRSFYEKKGRQEEREQSSVGGRRSRQYLSWPK